MVVSHDRYFVERVCDDVYAIEGGGVRHLPGGIDQYLRERERGAGAAAADEPASPNTHTAHTAATSSADGLSPGAAAREARKQARSREIEAKRMESAIEKLTAEEATLETEMATSATDHGRLGELQVELERLVAERERFEASWLELAESLER